MFNDFLSLKLGSRSKIIERQFFVIDSMNHFVHFDRTQVVASIYFLPIIDWQNCLMRDRERTTSIARLLECTSKFFYIHFSMSTHLSMCRSLIAGSFTLLISKRRTDKHKHEYFIVWQTRQCHSTNQCEHSERDSIIREWTA